MQIERANKILFDETDKVKALHGKMLQSDAIKENAALVDFKKQIDVLYKAQEAAFVEQQRQALEVFGKCSFLVLFLPLSPSRSLLHCLQSQQQHQSPSVSSSVAVSSVSFSASDLAPSSFASAWQPLNKHFCYICSRAIGMGVMRGGHQSSMGFVYTDAPLRMMGVTPGMEM